MLLSYNWEILIEPPRTIPKVFIKVFHPLQGQGWKKGIVVIARKDNQSFPMDKRL